VIRNDDDDDDDDNNNNNNNILTQIILKPRIIFHAVPVSVVHLS
jgi:hypothetical protein